MLMPNGRRTRRRQRVFMWLLNYVPLVKFKLYQTLYQSSSTQLTVGNEHLEDEVLIPVFQPRTQTYITDPSITESEVRLALDYLNPRKGASNCSGPEDWRHAIATPVVNPQHNRPITRMPVACKILETILK